MVRKDIDWVLPNDLTRNSEELPCGHCEANLDDPDEFLICKHRRVCKTMPPVGLAY
jgi:hypothetical protein